MILANDRAFNCSFFGISTAGNMHIVITGSTVVEIADFFSRKTNLEKICYESNGESYESVSYTHLTLPTKRIV